GVVIGDFADALEHGHGWYWQTHRIRACGENKKPAEVLECRMVRIIAARTGLAAFPSKQKKRARFPEPALESLYR
ncbi:MAG: hypothetical protein P8011_19515, partial [Acidihalobacter sp.]